MLKSFRFYAFLFLFFLFAHFLVYAHALDNPFLESDSFWLKLAKDKVFFSFSIVGSGIGFRPLAAVFVYGMYVLFKNQPMPYHVAGITLHAANAFLLFFLVNALLHSFPRARFTALLSAFLFSFFYPLSQGVIWLAAIYCPLALFFMLLSLIFLFYFITSKKFIYQAASLAAFFLTTVSYEVQVIFPFIVVFFYGSVFSLQEKEMPLKTAAKHLLPYFILCFLFPGLFYVFHYGEFFHTQHFSQAEHLRRLLDFSAGSVKTFAGALLSLYGDPLYAEKAENHTMNFLLYKVCPALQSLIIAAFVFLLLRRYQRQVGHKHASAFTSSTMLSSMCLFCAVWILLYFFIFGVFGRDSILDTFTLPLSRYAYLPAPAFCFLCAVIMTQNMQRIKDLKAAKFLGILFLTVYFTWNTASTVLLSKHFEFLGKNTQSLVRMLKPFCSRAVRRGTIYMINFPDEYYLFNEFSLADFLYVECGKTFEIKWVSAPKPYRAANEFFIYFKNGNLYDITSVIPEKP